MNKRTVMGLLEDYQGNLIGELVVEIDDTVDEVEMMVLENPSLAKEIEK
jgi:hypothetical protein